MSIEWISEKKGEGLLKYLSHHVGHHVRHVMHPDMVVCYGPYREDGNQWMSEQTGEGLFVEVA